MIVSCSSNSNQDEARNTALFHRLVIPHNKKVHSATKDELVSELGENELQRKVISAGAISNWSVIEVRRLSSQSCSSVRSHQQPVGYFSNKISVIKKDKSPCNNVLNPVPVNVSVPPELCNSSKTSN